MKRASIIIFYFLFTAQILVAQKNLYVSSDNGVNLREGPGTGYKTTVSIPAGSKLDVVSTEGDWVKVKYDGKTGYVSRQYLSEDKPKSSNASKNDNKRKEADRAQNNRKDNSRTSSGSSDYNDRNWGVGVRFGDPLGLTVKKYFASGNALEFNIGSTTYGRYDYRDNFYDNDKYKDYDYLNYRRSGAMSFQVHYLFQKDIPGAKNLQWYWGVGGQIRSKSYRYNYRYREYYGPGQGDYLWVMASDKVRNIDFGADVTLGLEYHLPKAPLSIFLDANLFLEFLDDPFMAYGQGGIGIRYNF